MNGREMMLSYIRHETPGMLPDELVLSFPLPGYVAQPDVPVCERTLDQDGYDVFGVHWSCIPPNPTHPTPVGKHIITDIEAWRDQARFPDPDKFDWDYLRAQNASLDRKNEIVSVILCVGPFERTTTLMSFEECLVAAISEPELYSELIGAITDFRIGVIEHIAECVKPDIITLHDDWGSARAPLMNPELWRRTIKPHAARLYEAVRRRGIPVCQHSCGCIGPLVDDIVELGADAWEGQGKCNDLGYWAKRHAGRLLIVCTDIDRNREADGVMRLRQFEGYSEPPAFLWK